MGKHIIYGIVILSLIGFAYWWGESKENEGRQAERNIWLEKENAQHLADLAEIERLTNENAALVSRIAQDQRTIAQKQRFIRKWENKYATDIQKSNACNLSLASVQLFNCAIGAKPADQCAAEFIDSTGAASTITGADFIGKCNEVGEVGERTALQLEGLIQAVKNNQ